MQRSIHKIRTDVLIAGAGPAGSTYARILAGAGRRTLMLDTGPQYSRRPGECLKNAFIYQRCLENFTPLVRGFLHPISIPPRGSGGGALDPISFQANRDSIRNAMNPKQDASRNLEGAAAAFAVGGMMLHWTGNIPRPHPTMEMIQFIPKTELEHFYSEAEHMLNRHTNTYIQSLRHNLVKDALQQFYGRSLKPPYHVQELPIAAERSKQNDELVFYTGTDRILGALLDHGEDGPLTIWPQHRVKRLKCRGERVEYAEVEDLVQFKTYHVEANEFIVACGPVLTPQVLWNSKIRPPALGRYLTEHPMAFTQVVLRQELVDSVYERFKDHPNLKRNLAKDARTKGAIPFRMRDPAPMVWIPVSQGRPWHAQVHKDSFHYGEIPADIDDRLIVDLRWFGMVEPRPENRVFFDRDPNFKDAFGMPRPTFDFTLTHEDRSRQHAMMEDMTQAAHALGGFFPGAEPRFMTMGTALHIQGTCRMGPQDDGTSVTDPNLRVWGMKNLRLGGNGVIPTMNACNPTLTTVTLALRAAQAMLTPSIPKPC